MSKTRHWFAPNPPDCLSFDDRKSFSFQKNTRRQGGQGCHRTACLHDDRVFRMGGRSRNAFPALHFRESDSLRIYGAVLVDFQRLLIPGE